MNVEIERKFLVSGDFKNSATRSIHIVQGYLSSVPVRTVRVRISGDKAFLTVKGIGSESGMSRFEWEKDISVEDAEKLLEIAEPGVIEKTRYLVPSEDGAHVWEVDEFEGRLKGLVLAEIELSSESEAFELPAWAGKEVTGDPAYYNSSLRR